MFQCVGSLIAYSPAGYSSLFSTGLCICAISFGGGTLARAGHLNCDIIQLYTAVEAFAMIVFPYVFMFFWNSMNHRPKIPTIFQCRGEKLDRGQSYCHACPAKGNSATATIYTGLPWFTSWTQSTDYTRSIQMPIVSCSLSSESWQGCGASPVCIEGFESFCSEEAVRALNGFDKSSNSAPGKLNHSDLMWLEN